MDHPLVPLGADDAEAVHDLVQRWESHWETPLRTPLSELEEDLRGPHLSLTADTRAVWVGGRLAGYAMVSHSRSGARLERAFVDGKVDPGLVGNGYGRRLLAWSIERAVERLRDSELSIPWYVRAYEWDWVHPSLRLYRRFGLDPVRYFQDMVRPLDDPLPVGPPPEVRIEPWAAPDPEAVRSVRNDAFADHWGSTPIDRSSWDHLMAGEHMRTDLSWVATHGDEIVGVCLNAHFPGDEEVTGRRDGWIDQLAVAKRWRGRGIATALIASSVDSFRQAGFTHAMLGVDTDSPTGAVGLYQRLGFTPLHRTVTYELEVARLSR